MMTKEERNELLKKVALELITTGTAMLECDRPDIVLQCAHKYNEITSTFLLALNEDLQNKINTDHSQENKNVRL